MESKFVALLACTKSYLQEREEKSEKVLNQFINLLKMLPLSQRHRGRLFLRHMRSLILIMHVMLMKSLACIGTTLIMLCIIMEFGSTKLQKKMRVHFRS